MNFSGINVTYLSACYIVVKFKTQSAVIHSPLRVEYLRAGTTLVQGDTTHRRTKHGLHSSTTVVCGPAPVGQAGSLEGEGAPVRAH